MIVLIGYFACNENQKKGCRIVAVSQSNPKKHIKI